MLLFDIKVMFMVDKWKKNENKLIAWEITSQLLKATNNEILCAPLSAS